MAHLLVRQGMLFTDDEVIKSCLIIAAEGMCSEKINLCKTISHSASRVAQKLRTL